MTSTKEPMIQNSFSVNILVVKRNKYQISIISMQVVSNAFNVSDDVDNRA